jgi:carboxymethylenebutenolidase
MGGSYTWREPASSQPQHFSKWVDFGTRAASGSGLLCYSQASGPGVVLLHEFFGLQDSFKDYAARLSGAGFTVLAPDLYDGVLATTVEEAIELRDGIEAEWDQTVLRIEAAADFLVDNWHPRLGVIGFSLGASFADALARRRTVEATVFYYGWGETDPGGFTGPLLVHLATDDEWMELDEARQAINDFENAGVNVEAHIYPATGHWFANPAVQSAYRDNDAALAFERTVTFLRHHLA